MNQKMKKVLSTLVVALAFVGFAFTTAPKATTFKVDTQKSIILWNGKKVTGEHSGTIKLAGGTLSLSGTNLTQGSFTIDMTTITSTDGAGARLEGHLKADDFFGVEKFPTANFVITKVTPAAAGKLTVSGNLTIKGITKALSFPATLAVKGTSLTAVAKGVKVDRTKYDIRYGSKSFFDSIGDKAIDDEFTLDITLVAIK
jgi:polyisoprenoid-binding protein YceI